MIKRKGYVIAMALGLAVLTACGEKRSEAEGFTGAEALAKAPEPMADSSKVASSSQAAQTNGSSHGAQDGIWVLVPASLRFPNVDNVEAAPSWSARVARLPVTDQAYLSEVSDRYFGTLEFLDEDEQRELVQQGFPMPEEWLAARNLPIEELQWLAEQGNVKAKMFYIDRISVEMAQMRARGDGIQANPAGRAQLAEFATATRMARDLVQTTSSPFSAYLAGAIYASGSNEAPPEVFAGSFRVAQDLGHDRAREFQGRYFAAHPDMNASVVMSSYSHIKSFTKQ